MKKIDLALLIGLIVAILLSNFSAFAEDCDEVRHSVMRLHILANSDSEEDQALKLDVRDRILAENQKWSSGDDSLAMAEQSVEDNLALIEAIARDEISARGYDYGVRAELTNMYFTTRVYEDITMPAGYYDALRIVIGEGKGQNWWCVLFPPLCLPAAIDRKEFFTADELKLIESGNKYEIKFKLVEWFERLQDFLGKKLIKKSK